MISYFIWRSSCTWNCFKSLWISFFFRKSNKYHGSLKEPIVEESASKKRFFYAIRRYEGINPTRKRLSHCRLLFTLLFLISFLTLNNFKFECTCLMDLSLEGKLNLCKEVSGVPIFPLIVEWSMKFVKTLNPGLPKAPPTNWFLRKRFPIKEES